MKSTHLLAAVTLLVLHRYSRKKRACMLVSKLCIIIHTNSFIHTLNAVTQAEPRVADVQFNFRGEVERDSYEGLLEVFVDTPDGHKWTGVCYDESRVKFNDGAAAAACRQNNFNTYESYGSAKVLG